MSEDSEEYFDGIYIGPPELDLDDDNNDSFDVSKLSAEQDTNNGIDVTQNWRDKIRRKSALVMGNLRDKFQTEREYCNW